MDAQDLDHLVGRIEKPKAAADSAAKREVPGDAAAIFHEGRSEAFEDVIDMIIEMEECDGDPDGAP